VLVFAEPRRRTLGDIDLSMIDMRPTAFGNADGLTLAATQGQMDDDGAGDTLDGVATVGMVR
jgi:hypothetical protein